MYTADKIKKIKNDLKTNEQDISENQLNTFHVEHKKQADKEIQQYSKLKTNMKKFEAITVNRKEFLFAPNLEQAGAMFYQLYGHSAQINEVEKIISE